MPINPAGARRVIRVSGWRQNSGGVWRCSHYAVGVAGRCEAGIGPSRAAPGETIGIDDVMRKGKPGRVSDEQQRAERFAERFRAVYLTFHRRDGPRSQLQGASRAVLEHLAMAGPLTIGEAAAHLNRAQSVISEIVSHLEGDGLLERESDPADRRRTLVWLTPAGQAALRRDREVLGLDQLARALARLPPGQADALIAGLGDLVQAVASTSAQASIPPCPNEEESNDDDRASL